MSNPISSKTSESPSNVTRIGEEPELEVDEILEEGGAPPALEVDPIGPERGASAMDAPKPAPAQAKPAKNASTAAPRQRNRMGRVAFVLAVLLILSFAYNLKQTGDYGALELRSQEMEIALTDAVEIIDVETGRANLAESTLSGIDAAVENVNARMQSLQEALGELREATAH